MSRFLIPILTLKDNGGGAVAMSFARSLRDKGMDVVVLSSGFHGRAAVRRPENAGLRFVISPHGFGGRVTAVALFLLYGIGYSLVRRPRVVYTHIATGLIPDFSGNQSAMLAQDLEYRFFCGRRRRVMKWLFDHVTKHARLITTSLWLEKFFRRRRLNVLFSGDVGISQAFFGQPVEVSIIPRPVDFLLIAKHGHHKRHDETCAVALGLAERGFRVVLIDQAPQAQVPLRAPGLRTLDAVSQAAMRELFRQSMVFIGLSRAEGYGLTPLEALSQGCRVVTTRTPSTSRFESEALKVIAGGKYLVERAIEAALKERALAAAAEHNAAPSYGGPFMEDWCNRAAQGLVTAAELDR